MAYTGTFHSFFSSNGGRHCVKCRKTVDEIAMSGERCKGYAEDYDAEETDREIAAERERNKGRRI